MSKEIIKYINPVQMILLNNKAIRKNFNRSLEKDFVKAIQRDILIPIVFHLPHNEHEVRCQMAIPSLYIDLEWWKKKNKDRMTENMVKFWLDMTVEDFNGLESHEAEKEDN